MSQSTINRPACGESNYTKLPNELFNLGHYYPQLKPRDTSVLLYLLSKKSDWNIDPKATAKALNMGVWTVGEALRSLQKVGIASFKRFADGHTHWTIQVPDFHPATPVIKPQLEIPSWEKPAWVIHSVLETNVFLETNKETTNVIVSKKDDFNDTDGGNDCGKNSQLVAPPAQNFEPIAPALPAQLSEPEKKAVTRELSVISDDTLKALVITALTTALLTREINNPVGYARVLAQKANNGTFTAPKAAANKPLSPLEREKQAKQKLRDFMTRNLDKLKRDFLELKKDYIHISGLGNITRYTFNEYLASVGGAAC